MPQEETRYHRRGFGLKQVIQAPLRNDYHSQLVEDIRAAGYRLSRGRLTVRLAEQFGFCYGVDRAVEYAYETRTQFPDRRLFLIGEIIHNPNVNGRLRDMGIIFLDPPEPLIQLKGNSLRLAGSGGAGTSTATSAEPYAGVGAEDVVIIPAFGVPVRDLDLLRKRGCILVDTTCGSVLNVWKNVDRYAREGFTSIIHGKYWHEETRATASRAQAPEGGHYLVLRDLQETAETAAVITGEADPEAFAERQRDATSPGFDPARHLERIGLANQTTMLSSESLEISEVLRKAMLQRWGEAETARRFRAFDTICSATQERQDAVLELLEEKLDLMIVVGGFNSSNTSHLAEIAARRFPAYHIEDASGVLSAWEIHHKSVDSHKPILTRDWLPDGPVTVGLTSGASTPNSKVGEVIERLASCCGVSL
ncbi:MAG: 4-hydroxy-3-methylbut-2-enyl diphosphate reductase [Acidobacteriota bacterium]